MLLGHKAEQAIPPIAQIERVAGSKRAGGRVGRPLS